MSSRLLVIAALAALVQPQPAAAQPVDHIDWLAADSHQTERGKPGDGMADKLVRHMQAEWPQVQHRLRIANAKRIWQMIAAGEQVCSTASVRTPEREQLAYFTNTQIAPPMELIARRDKLEALPLSAGGEVDLARLLAKTQLRGALVEGRSYGRTIDAQLAGRLAEAKAVTLYATADFGSQLLPMLAADRADFTIEFSADLRLDADRDRLNTLLVALPIQGAAEPVAGGIACPRTPWGLAAIRGIDQVIGTPAGAAMLRKSFEDWHAAGMSPAFRQRVDAFYRDRAKPAVIR